MTRIRCRDRRCAFNKNGICISDEIEYDPDEGCLTLELRADVDDAEEEWEDDEELEEAFDDDFEDEDEESDDDGWADDEEDEDNDLLGRRRHKR